MTYKLEKLTDNSGLEYFGIVIDESEVQPFFTLLEQLEPSQKIERLRHSREERDGDCYHLTIINPFELKASDSRFLESCEFETHDIKLLGLGKVEKDGSIAY